MKPQTFFGMSNLGFDFIPPVGTTIENSGQVLTLRAHEEEKHNITGAPMLLLMWSSKCAECGAPYMFRTSWARPRLARRCLDHSKWNTRIKWPAGTQRNNVCRITFPPDAVDPQSLF